MNYFKTPCKRTVSLLQSILSTECTILNLINYTNIVAMHTLSLELVKDQQIKTIIIAFLFFRKILKYISVRKTHNVICSLLLTLQIYFYQLVQPIMKRVA